MTPYSRLGCSGALLGLLSLCGGCGGRGGPPVAMGPTPASVRVDEVTEAEVVPEETFVGMVAATQSSVVGSAVAGRVIAYRFPSEQGGWVVPAEEGQWVVADQPLIQMLTRTHEIEIAAAEAELRLRQEELVELQNGSRPEEVAQARAAVQRAEALRSYAASRLTRVQDLHTRGQITSLEEVEEGRSAADAAEQSKLQAEAVLQLTLEGPREEQIRQSEARLAMQQAEVARLQDLLGKYTVKAPFDGYVVAKLAEQGQWVSSGDPVMEVVSVEVEITVAVPEHYIHAIRPGSEASVRIAALGQQPIAATIDRIVPRADPRSRTFPVKLRLENPSTDNGHLFKSGMLAQVTLRVAQSRRSLLVPKDALVLGGQQPLVYLVREDPTSQELKAVPVPVVLGAAREDRNEVTGELQVGERIIVEGNERLRPGAIVQVMGNPAA
jgi:HlyD family secretion protein